MFMFMFNVHVEARSYCEVNEEGIEYTLCSYPSYHITKTDMIHTYATQANLLLYPYCTLFPVIVPNHIIELAYSSFYHIEFCKSSTSEPSFNSRMAAVIFLHTLSLVT